MPIVRATKVMSLSSSRGASPHAALLFALLAGCLTLLSGCVGMGAVLSSRKVGELDLLHLSDGPDAYRRVLGEPVVQELEDEGERLEWLLGNGDCLSLHLDSTGRVARITIQTGPYRHLILGPIPAERKALLDECTCARAVELFGPPHLDACSGLPCPQWYFDDGTILGIRDLMGAGCDWAEGTVLLAVLNQYAEDMGGVDGYPCMPTE